MRAVISIAVLGCAVFSAACPGDFEVEDKTFPCRAAGDCVEGYECHPTRFVCVVAGSIVGAIDSGVAELDSGAGGAGEHIGDLCTAQGTCTEGQCVDGYCCASACTDVCHRCDQTPGQCLPVLDGTDPDQECTTLDFNCAAFTAGISGSACFAGLAKTVSGGTCSAEGACRPVGCDGENGVQISSCVNVGCLIEGACPAGAPVADFDSTGELCMAGTGCE